MKLVHITDQHCGGAYPEKVEKSFNFLIDQLWNDPLGPAFMPDVIYSTGDLTDRPLHVQSEHLKPFLAFVKAAQCPIVMLQGTMSHEPLGAINNLAAIADGKLLVIDSPFAEARIGKFSIKGIPGLSRPLIAKWCRERGIPIDGFDDPQEALRAILADISNNWSSGVRVLGGHLTVTGAKTSTGQTMTGGDIELSLDDLCIAQPHVVTLGHIHQHQVWTHKGIHIAYGGSPQNCNWGELDTKGFSVYEFTEEGQLISFERIPFPHKPMIKVELEFSGEQLPDGSWNYNSDDDIDDIFLGDKEVKCVYTIPREIAATVDDAYVRVLFGKYGVNLTAIERIIKTESRERIEAISTLQTTAQQYEAVCKARSVDIRPGAIAKADLIDQQGVTV